MRSFSQVMKDNPSVGDVHVPAAMGQKRRPGQVPIAMLPAEATALRKRFEAAKDDAVFVITVPITKIDDELHTVYGWATVNSEGGQVVTDHQDDQVSDLEMTKAAHDFMSSSRNGGLLHANDLFGQPHKGGDVVESMVLTDDVQKALGIDLGKTGWFIGYHVNEPDAWTLVKSGVLKAFSIGGRAVRVPIK